MQLIPVIEEKQKSIQAPLLARQFTVSEEKQSVFAKENLPNVALSTLSPQELLERAIEKIEKQNTKQHAQEEEQRPVTILPPSVPGTDRISSLRLLGCIHRLFYIAENEYGLVIIDQHAAHERVLYEQFMQQYRAKNIAVQELLVPQQMEFSPSELLLLEEQKEALQRLGFFFEAFGGRTILLRSVPAVLGKIVNKEVVHDILAQFEDKTTVLDELKEEKIIRSACRAAVKAQDVVHEEEMKQIVLQLQQCKQPFTCPHGRPTMIQLSVPELERKFKRVV
jgi:DNA mismatch repair protein MutL